MTFQGNLSELMAALTVANIMESVAWLATFGMANLPEILGTVAGIAGALMLALNNRYSSWAWPVWVASNIAWIVYALDHHSYGFLVQQIVFTVINLVGIRKWFSKPKQKFSEAATC